MTHNQVHHNITTYRAVLAAAVGALIRRLPAGVDAADPTQLCAISDLAHRYAHQTVYHARQRGSDAGIDEYQQ